MSTEPTGGETKPIIRLEKMYVKDLSFENPNAPEVFRQRTAPRAEVNLTLHRRKIGEDHWEVSLTISANLKHEETVVFIVEVEHAGLFLVKNVPEEHLPAVLGVECPTALFPFSRQIVSQAVVDGGFVPFLLDPVNFLAMFRSSQQRTEQQPTH